jgi:2-isopropylmalate synthase
MSTISVMKDPNYYADLYNAYEKNPKKIRVLDSTLREGEQHPGVSFTVKQRIQIAWMLDYFGVDQIEISPIVSDDHKEAVKTIIKQGLKADIVSHGRALKEDIDVSLSCDATWCAAYLGISDIHLKDKLRITRDQAMERAVGTIEYAKSHGLKIRFTVEDGSRADPEFLLKMCRAIEEAGVDRISLPDTVGILRPVGMHNFVKKVREAVDTPLDAHVHNDIGFALANAFAACDAGADQIHTTIDGIGERTGIPPLAEVSVALTYLYKSPNDFRLDMLQDLSRLIEVYTSIRPYDSKPIVGTSAYKHKAGTHLAAILRNPAAYEPIPPREVGNRRRIVFGELAGKTGASYLMSILGLEKDDESAKAVARGLKNLRLGDLIEIPLEDRLEKKIIKDGKRENPRKDNGKM